MSSLLPRKAVSIKQVSNDLLQKNVGLKIETFNYAHKYVKQFAHFNVFSSLRIKMIDWMTLNLSVRIPYFRDMRKKRPGHKKKHSLGRLCEVKQQALKATVVKSKSAVCHYF
jgi:hypothetical protein